MYAFTPGSKVMNMCPLTITNRHTRLTANLTWAAAVPTVYYLLHVKDVGTLTVRTWLSLASERLRVRVDRLVLFSPFNHNKKIYVAFWDGGTKLYFLCIIYHTGVWWSIERWILKAHTNSPTMLRKLDSTNTCHLSTSNISPFPFHHCTLSSRLPINFWEGKRQIFLFQISSYGKALSGRGHHAYLAKVLQASTAYKFNVAIDFSYI